VPGLPLGKARRIAKNGTSGYRQSSLRMRKFECKKCSGAAGNSPERGTGTLEVPMQSESTPRGIPAATIEALVNEHPADETRVLRGLEMIDQVEATCTPGLYLVRSGSSPNQAYQVDATSCSCPDRQTRSNFCKHMAARSFFIARERAEAQADDPNRDGKVTALPERVYSDADRFELTTQGVAYLNTTLGA
jgi:hypothetical protein